MYLLHVCTSCAWVRYGRNTHWSSGRRLHCETCLSGSRSVPCSVAHATTSSVAPCPVLLRRKPQPQNMARTCYPLTLNAFGRYPNVDQHRLSGRSASSCSLLNGETVLTGQSGLERLGSFTILPSLPSGALARPCPAPVSIGRIQSEAHRWHLAKRTENRLIWLDLFRHAE